MRLDALSAYGQLINLQRDQVAVVARFHIIHAKHQTHTSIHIYKNIVIVMSSYIYNNNINKNAVLLIKIYIPVLFIILLLYYLFIIIIINNNVMNSHNKQHYDYHYYVKKKAYI